MRRFGSSVHLSLLLSIALLLAARLSAQTLENRQPVKSEPPQLAVTPVTVKTPLPLAEPIVARGTNLQVQITRHFPMKAGETIEGRLLHPIFVQGRLAVPQNTTLRGTVVTLKPDTNTRWHGRLRGDFTPFHTAQVQFNQLLLPSGAVAISTSGATSGAPVLHLGATRTRTIRSLFSRYWSQAKSQLHDRVAYFTAPGLGDRALQMLYHQLPYHPERIEANTMWSFELTAPLRLTDYPPAPATSDLTEPASAGNPEMWTIHAMLTSDLTSATAKSGDAVKALVLEPVLDKNRELVVPQDSMLVGRVTAAKAARTLGRNGKLRFTFQQVLFPQGAGLVPVEGSLAGATAESAQGLSLDSEGSISPRSQSSAIAPLLLTVLAGRALDSDGNLTVGTGVASNGFGLAGRVVGLATGSRNLAAGIGYYAAGLSFYENFLRRGHDVVFPKNTRIEIETTSLRSPVLTPEKQ